MKIIDIAKNIDKSDINNTGYIDFDAIASDLGVPFSFYEDPPDDRLQAYWVGKWYCTDSWVGYRMYFFDDEPVAVSVQQGRKCSENFHWFSEDAVSRVKDYVLSLIARENNHASICDVNEDIGDSYKIEFLSQVLDWKMARYKDHEIEVIETIKDEKDYYGLNATVRIKDLSTQKEYIVEPKDLDFVFHLSDSHKKISLDKHIQSASALAAASQPTSYEKVKEFAPEI